MHNGTRFYEKYISSKNKKQYIDDDGSGVFPNSRLERSKIQNINLFIQIAIML